MYSCENEINKSTTGVLKWQDIQEVIAEVMDEAVAQIMEEVQVAGVMVIDQAAAVVLPPEREMDIYNTIPVAAGNLPTVPWRKKIGWTNFPGV